MLYIALAITLSIIIYVLKSLYTGRSYLNKDKQFLQFKHVAHSLNNTFYSGKGTVTRLNNNSYNLYKRGANQLINFVTDQDLLVITWRYKQLKKEIKHEKTFYNVYNKSESEQQEIALLFTEEVQSSIRKMEMIPIAEDIK